MSATTPCIYNERPGLSCLDLGAREPCEPCRARRAKKPREEDLVTPEAQTINELVRRFSLTANRINALTDNGRRVSDEDTLRVEELGCHVRALAQQLHAIGERFTKFVGDQLMGDEIDERMMKELEW